MNILFLPAFDDQLQGIPVIAFFEPQQRIDRQISMEGVLTQGRYMRLSRPPASLWIVTSVKQVAVITSEIVVAGEKQSSGIEEMNRAIVHMDGRYSEMQHW